MLYFLSILTFLVSISCVSGAPSKRDDTKVGGCKAAGGSNTKVASTSFYGNQGSACELGDASFQWSSTPGHYKGAVSQSQFQGSLNSAGKPNCGRTCGQCYTLTTTGVNAYPGGVGSGSTIEIMIVDACYAAETPSYHNPWCASTAAGYENDQGCGVHFDLQTGPPGSGGVEAKGADGRMWSHGGEIVTYDGPHVCSDETINSEFDALTQCPASSRMGDGGH